MTAFKPLSTVALTCADTPDRFGTAYIGTEEHEISVELHSAACNFKFTVTIDSACARQLAAALLAQADVFDAMNATAKGAAA